MLYYNYQKRKINQMKGADIYGHFFNETKG